MNTEKAEVFAEKAINMFNDVAGGVVQSSNGVKDLVDSLYLDCLLMAKKVGTSSHPLAKLLAETCRERAYRAYTDRQSDEKAARALKNILVRAHLDKKAFRVTLP